jgi:hypothetical protein
VIHKTGVPEWLENSIGKPKSENVLHRFFA